jgi:glycosyltransferase involved in cell wall biosynthesis
MRILHVINSLDPSGAERHLANLLGPLKALGVENHLVTFYPGNGFEAQVSAHVRHARLNVGILRALDVTTRMARDADVVHTQLLNADIIGRTAAAIARRPSFTTLQASLWSPESGALSSHERRWRRNAMWLGDAVTSRLAQRFFAVSDATGRSYAKDLHVPEARIEVLANSVDLAEFSPDKGPTREEARRALGFADGEFAVVSLSRLNPQKGLGDAIRAVSQASKHRPIRLKIAGLGAEKEKLEALTRELNAPVDLVGRRDAVTAYKAADLFLLTSYYEGMPLALIEAMAMGVPCLCSSIPENTTTAGDAAEWIKVGDVNGFANALVALADNETRRRELSRMGIQRSQRYAADVVAARFLEGIKRALVR